MGIKQEKGGEAGRKKGWSRAGFQRDSKGKGLGERQAQEEEGCRGPRLWPLLSRGQQLFRFPFAVWPSALHRGRPPGNPAKVGSGALAGRSLP